MMECRNVPSTTELTKWYERHGLPPQTGEGEGTSDSDTVTIKRTAFEEIWHDRKRQDVRSEVVMQAFAEAMQNHVKGIVDMVAAAKRAGLWVEFNLSDVEFSELIDMLKNEDVISGAEDAEEAIKSARTAMQNAEDSAEEARSELDDVAYTIQSAMDSCSTAESYCNDARGELDGVEL
jgi:hypothetical protein